MMQILKTPRPHFCFKWYKEANMIIIKIVLVRTGLFSVSVLIRHGPDCAWTENKIRASEPKTNVA